MSSERVVNLRPTAADAWNRIEKHEAVCAERYKNMSDDLKDIKKLLWSVGGAVGVTMLSVLGYLVVHIIPGLHP